MSEAIQQMSRADVRQRCGLAEGCLGVTIAIFAIKLVER
jgi:hypothetical protein